MIRLILVALDGSPSAEQALPHAGRFAAQTGATLLLVQAAMGGMAEDEAYLSVVQRRLAQDGHRVRSMVVGGEPAHAILTATRREQAQMIAMVTYGSSSVLRLVPGSVVDTVVRHATVPVLLVPASEHPSPASEAMAYRRILVPLDGSAAAETALALVAREGLTTAADVVLLRAIPALVAPGLPEGVQISARRLREQAGWQTEHALLAARDYLERVAYTYVPHTIPRFCVPIAYPAKAILDLAAYWSIDLIVMTTRGAGHGRHIHGGVAAHVLRHTSVPVLCLPGTGASTPAKQAETIPRGMAQPEPALADAC